jgi:hypothetical protein
MVKYLQQEAVENMRRIKMKKNPFLDIKTTATNGNWSNVSKTVK